MPCKLLKYTLGLMQILAKSSPLDYTQNSSNPCLWGYQFGLDISHKHGIDLCSNNILLLVRILLLEYYVNILLNSKWFGLKQHKLLAFEKNFHLSESNANNIWHKSTEPAVKQNMPEFHVFKSQSVSGLEFTKEK